MQTKIKVGLVLLSGFLLTALSAQGQEAFPNPALAKTPIEAAKSQNSPASAGSSQQTKADAKAEIEALKQQITKQQAQLDELRNLVQKLEDQTNAITQNPARTLSQTPAPPKTAGTPLLASIDPKAASAALPPVTVSKPEGLHSAQEGEEEHAAPPSLHIGSAYITPVGFMDFTTVWRSHDGGSGIGTNFASIPYGNVFQNNLSEFRLSMQNSRIGFRVDAMVHGAHVIGYMESDFLGNNPSNVAVSSNSNTLRSRLYWADVRKGGWEVLGGQTWSLITPGRTGISPLPSDLFYTQDIDVNYQLGLFWGRIPEFRLVYHASDKAHFAVALESPEQYVGGSAGGGLVTFPSVLATIYAGELNVGTNTLNVPNLAPDVIAKLALDPSKRFHFEVGGVERSFKVWNPTSNTTFTSVGGGGFANLNFELFKGLRILTANYYSDGGGRYIFGQAPDLIAKADGSLSLIHADSTVTGFEYTKNNSLIYGYYGGAYIGRNVAIDDTTGKPVGYGYAGASAGQNKAIQEGTFGFAQTFWKDAKYGALTFMGQYSYVTRSPWSVATGQPKEANLGMVFLNLRYTLPGSAPAMK